MLEKNDMESNRSLWKKGSDLLELIKFSHTVFALPFAFSAMCVAADGFPSIKTLLGIIICMVGARTAAMAFNRWADWDFDLKNPRTQHRSKLTSRASALFLSWLGVVVFLLGTLLLPWICTLLSPIALIWVLGYSLVKRFSSLAHGVLGIALGLAPVGAWMAVRGEFISLAPWLLFFGVWAWVFGFDLVYAAQDIDADKKTKLHSFPAKFGLKKTILLSRILHVGAWMFFLLFGLWTHQSFPYGIALLVTAYVLWFGQRRFQEKGDIQKINHIFFQINGIVSVSIFLGVVTSLWIQ